MEAKEDAQMKITSAMRLKSAIWIMSFEIEYVEKARKAVDGKKDVELRPIQVCGVNRKSFNP
jgi:hypothetical protein